MLNSETETLPYYPARQPSTDTFRFWEVAGTAHVSVERNEAASTPGMDSPNWLSYAPVYDAAVRHMHRWLSEGVAPPEQPLIEVAAEEDTAPTIIRDSRGNALGGVRVPEFAVPSAEHRGAGTRVEGGNRFAFLYGYAREFSGDELAALYSDQADFMIKYDSALYQALFAGVVLPEDAARLRGEAASWASTTLGSHSSSKMDSSLDR